MSARRRRGGHAEEHENEERWLLTYADMITLLMALFIVMFAMSTVNETKFKALQETLDGAFAAKVLPGGPAVLQSGSSTAAERPAPQQPIQAIRAVRVVPSPGQGGGGGGPSPERDEFDALKRQIDDYARRNGLEKEIETEVDPRRGLVVRLLTDRVLFESGEARLKPQGRPLLRQIARLLRSEVRHPLMVEGHTDSVPVRGGRFPSNWELSGVRATTVVRFLIGQNVAPGRLGASGYANRRPIARNDNEAGRRRNRRVEIVLLRLGDLEGEQG